MKFKEMLEIARAGEPDPGDDDETEDRSTELDGLTDREFQERLDRRRAGNGDEIEIEEELDEDDDEELDLGFLDDDDEAIQEVRARLDNLQFRED